MRSCYGDCIKGCESECRTYAKHAQHSRHYRYRQVESVAALACGNHRGAHGIRRSDGCECTVFRLQQRRIGISKRSDCTRKQRRHRHLLRKKRSCRLGTRWGPIPHTNPRINSLRYYYTPFERKSQYANFGCDAIPSVQALVR